MTTPTGTDTHHCDIPVVGERVELARYRIPAGERILYGQRIDGVVRITDRPSSGGGRSYLVERELEQDGYAALQAVVADYVAQAGRLQAIPMDWSVLERYLAALSRGLVVRGNRRDSR